MPRMAARIQGEAAPRVIMGRHIERRECHGCAARTPAMHPEEPMRRIVAIGGGGFMMESAPSLLDEYLIRVAGARRLRICFVPTASGDAHDDLEKFYRAFARFPAQLSHLAFFR